MFLLMWTCQTWFQNKETNESALYGRLKFQTKNLSPGCKHLYGSSMGTSLGHLCPLCKLNVCAQILHLIELSVKSPCLHPVFAPAFTRYLFFHWYPQSKDILLNLSIKCWNSASNAQGSRLIIVVVQVRVMKLYVAAVEALRKKERTWSHLSAKCQ